MNIAFDAKRLFENTTGLGNYSRSLVKEIRKFSAVHKIHLFTPDIKKIKFDEFLSEDFQVHTADGKRLWRFKRMVEDLSSLKPDIFHGLSNELPVGIEKLPHTKSVVTIHDLIFIKHPEYYPFIDRIFYTEKFKRACKKADRIIAVSQATKQDVVNYFGIAEEKVSVIYQSCASVFYKSETEVIHPQGRPYFLFVSSITERKNLKIIIDALAKLSKADRPNLIVVGEGGTYKRQMLARISDCKLEDFVEFKGYVDNVQLKALYKNALATIYPSFYEGFGIPIVESLLCGTPVIASNLSSMPEAASGLGKLINPNNVEEVVSEMQKLMENPQRLNQGEINKIRGKFEPLKLAREVLGVYDELLKC